MSVFYVTFGSMYAHEPHPVLGDRPQLPDGWLTVTADSLDDAREKVFGMIGTAWCHVYEPDNMRTELYDAGDLGPLENMVAEQCECFPVHPPHSPTSPIERI